MEGELILEDLRYVEDIIRYRLVKKRFGVGNLIRFDMRLNEFTHAGALLLHRTVYAIIKITAAARLANTSSPI